MVTFLYRAGRDAPRKIFVSLRWYMITYATFLCLIRLLYTVLSGEWGSQSLWVSFCCDAVYVGVVNYTFGSAKRAGMIAHTSYIRCITLAALGTGMCLLMMGVRLIVALAVGVSMHVFELIVIWLLIFLVVVWFPATTDAFATNYMVVLAAGTAYIGYRMEALYTVSGVARYVLLVYVGWINLSLQYHLWLNLFFSRYISIAIVIGLVSLLAVYVPSPNSELSEWVSAAVDERAALVDSPYLEIYLSLWTQWVMDLCNISQTLVVSSEFIPTQLCASYLKMPDNLVLCTYIVFVVGQVFIIFVTLQTMSVLHRRRMSEARTKKMRSLCIYPITPIVFMIQMVRGVTTLIVAIIFVTSYMLLQHTLLPHVSVMAALPTTVKKVLSLLVTCAFIGFLDCAEVIHTSILRALGLCDPPAPDPQNPSDGVEG